MSEARKRRPYEPPPSELGPGQTSYTSITDKISSVVFTPHTPIQWFIVVGIGLCLIGLLQIAIAYLLYQGTGIWGLKIGRAHV